MNSFNNIYWALTKCQTVYEALRKNWWQTGFPGIPPANTGQAALLAFHISVKTCPFFLGSKPIGFACPQKLSQLHLCILPWTLVVLFAKWYNVRILSNLEWQASSGWIFSIGIKLTQLMATFVSGNLHAERLLCNFLKSTGSEELVSMNSKLKVASVSKRKMWQWLANFHPSRHLDHWFMDVSTNYPQYFFSFIDLEQRKKHNKIKCTFILPD